MYWPTFQADRCRFNPVRKSGKRECPECTVTYKAAFEHKPCVAHFDYARRKWCSGGERPTSTQKKGRRKRGRSAYAVGRAGLPTLGKR